MNNIFEIVRQTVALEMEANRGCLLGVVNDSFPHDAPDDDNNYEVDVTLKNQNLTLRRVPVAVGCMGMAALPALGDLVLVQFLNGDLNQPFVTGCFYNAGARPPLFHENDIVLERIAGDGSKTKTVIRIHGEDGSIQINVGDKVGLKMTADQITIEGDVQIKGDLFVENGRKTTIQGNVEIKGDLVVQNGNKTTISGNTITGS
ncbi:MAG TPA: phage baseplate assembly protein V [Candidatus Angelobacter sp.]|nr:phage baseplate assembly protein V [Candidatus Angelobacter sp.]